MAGLTVTPNPLVAGGTATISLTNATGSPVTVNISNGGSPPKTSSVVIHLDDDGNGSTTWSVPSDWDVAIFSTNQTEDISRIITQPG